MNDSFAKVAFLGALLSISTAANAVATCTAWLLQTDKSEFRTCVGDDGRQYCEQRWRKNNKTIKTVSCT